MGGGEFIELAGLRAQFFELVVHVAHAPQRAFLRDRLACEGDTRGRRIAFENLVDQPERKRFLGGDGVSRQDHGHGLVHADQPRQPLRSAGAWKQAELNFGQAEPRRRRCNAKMAGQRNFEPAAERGAKRRGNNRLANIFDLHV